MESLKETSTPDLTMSNSWAEGNQSPLDNEEGGDSPIGTFPLDDLAPRL